MEYVLLFVSLLFFAYYNNFNLFLNFISGDVLNIGPMKKMSCLKKYLHGG